MVLRENIVVSIMSEFVDNEGKELEKQDCERKAAKRLMKKLKKVNILVVQSLYSS